MSDKRYPTRMHEVLGVEPNEVFTWVDAAGNSTEYVVDNQGHLYRKQKQSNIESPRTMADIINNPERIIRRPRLTEEQVEALTALYRVFGCKWLVYDEKRNLSLASKRKPSRTESVGEWDFKGVTLDVWLSDVLTAFAPQGAPLDIVQTLKDAGVEVEG